MSWYYGYRPYVPVAQRRAQAAKYAAKLAKKEKRTLAPVQLNGRVIAASFWGKAWCENLERYSDFENRLPRGRTYVRNGSVIDLHIERGKVSAVVSGSEVYRVAIVIKTLPAPTWTRIKTDCARSIDSLIDLLQGRFEQAIMQRLTQREGGLFPQPKEIKMTCTCPDWAGMCKHVAATLYGIGARLDTAPELLFTLRAVDQLELINQAVAVDNLSVALQGDGQPALSAANLGEIFGIDLDTEAGNEAGGAKPASGVSGPVGRDKPQARARKKAAGVRDKSAKGERLHIGKQVSLSAAHATTESPQPKRKRRRVGSYATT